MRGIVSKPNQDGDGIIYEAENKVLGKFAKDALDNFLDSKKDAKELNKDLLLKKYFNDFVDNIQQIINKNGFVELTDSYRIIDTEENAFRYLSKRKEDTSLGNRMLFKDIIKAYVDGNIERQDIKHNDNLSGLAKHHSSYYVRVVNMFQSYLKDNNLNFDKTISDKIPLKNYVLIIDEINRANLSAVLGELIYALEYRGESVASMYAVDGENKLVLPPNLYIIGTMNTADRSVGYIDYAIRRRFAFVDVLPKDLSAELKDDFRQDIFARVAELFIKNYDVNVNYSNDDNKIEKSDYLTADFAPKDVWLGHSYFIQQYEKDVNGEDIKDHPIDFNLRIKYEIKPILREYVKDGILKESALSIIEELN